MQEKTGEAGIVKQKKKEKNPESGTRKKGKKPKTSKYT